MVALFVATRRFSTRDSQPAILQPIDLMMDLDNFDHPNVRVADSAIGKGVFARRDFLAEADIGQIQGEIIDDPDYGSDYGIDLEDGRTLEPGAPFRYLNHSCEPNCGFDIYDAEDEQGAAPHRVVLLTAIRPIEQGEELTIEYNWAADSAIPCLCNAVSCRGWIVSDEELEVLYDQLNGNFDESEDSDATDWEMGREDNEGEIDWSDIERETADWPQVEPEKREPDTKNPT
jgi:hypothetical protein